MQPQVLRLRLQSAPPSLRMTVHGLVGTTVSSFRLLGEVGVEGVDEGGDGGFGGFEGGRVVEIAEGF